MNNHSSPTPTNNPTIREGQSIGLHRPNYMNRVIFKSQTVEWKTPQELYRVLDSEFQFNLDPCPIGGMSDGTSQLFNSWRGKRVFCNPPYGPKIYDFLNCWSEADVSVYLLPARTDTRWFHELCLPFAKEIRFIRGRLKFGEAKHSAPFPSMIVVFDNQRRVETPAT